MYKSSYDGEQLFIYMDKYQFWWFTGGIGRVEEVCIRDRPGLDCEVGLRSDWVELRSDESWTEIGRGWMTGRTEVEVTKDQSKYW